MDMLCQRLGRGMAPFEMAYWLERMDLVAANPALSDQVQLDWRRRLPIAGQPSTPQPSTTLRSARPGNDPSLI